MIGIGIDLSRFTTKKDKKMRPKLGSAVAKGAKGNGSSPSTSPWLYAAGAGIATLALQKLLGGKRKNTVYNNYYFGSNRMPYTPRW